MSAGDGEVGLLAGGGCARRGKRQRSDDQSQNCLNRKCLWCNVMGHFPQDCAKSLRMLEEERQNNFYNTADIEDHWDEGAETNIMGEPYGN